MSNDLFLNYITQFKKNYNVRARPLFLNGVLEETGKTAANIILFQMLPEVVTANDTRALALNAENREVLKIFVISNTKDIYVNDKVSYVRTDKPFGIQFADIFAYFHENTINIVLFDSIVFDSTTLSYIKNLSTKQVGLICPRYFAEIPDEVDKYNLSSNKNPHNCFEFTGLAIHGKINIGGDLYVNMVGCINILISIATSKFNVVNLSEIVISYLLESHQPNQDTYITDNFPVLYSLPQLYFNESLDVALPDVTDFESFINEEVDCVYYTAPPLPIEEEIDICNVKNKILQVAYREYKKEYENKSSIIQDSLREYQRNGTSVIELNMEKLKTDKLAELSTYIHGLKATKESQIEEYRISKEASLSELYLNKVTALDIEIQKTRVEKLHEVEKKCQEELDSKLGTIKQIIQDTENSAHLSFQRDLDAYTRAMYNKANQEIEEHKASSRLAMNTEMTTLRVNLERQIETENEMNRRRLENTLSEYERCKKNEIINHYQTEYFLKYNTIIVDIENRTKMIENKRLEEIDRDLQLYKTMKTDELNNIDIAERKQLKEKLLKVEAQQLEELDTHINEIERSKLLDIEIKINTDVIGLREKKINEIEQSCLEYEKQLKLNAETSSKMYADSLRQELAIKHQDYKLEQQQISKKLIEEEYERIKTEKVKEHSAYLLEKFLNLDLLKQNELNAKFSDKQKELDLIAAQKKQESENELMAHREFLLKNVYQAIKEIKASEMSNLEEYKAVKLAEINFDNEVTRRRLEDSRVLFHEKQLQEITDGLQKEKEEINARLEKEYSEALLKQNKIHEKRSRAENKKKLEEIKTEHEADVNTLNRKFQDLILEFHLKHEVERTKTINEFETEKMNMQRELIKNHNEALVNLEHEYEETRTRYGDMMKKSFNDERLQMIEAERLKIEESLVEYRRQLIERDREQIMKEKVDATEQVLEEVASLKQLKIDSIEREIAALKEERVVAIEKELRLYKEKNEDLIRKEFNTLVRGLKELQ